jgi:hypothetical protein
LSGLTQTLERNRTNNSFLTRHKSTRIRGDRNTF